MWKNYFRLFSVTQVLVYSWMRRWIKLAISNPTQSLLSSLCPPSTFVKVTQLGGFKLKLCFRQIIIMKQFVFLLAGVAAVSAVAFCPGEGRNGKNKRCVANE